MASLEGGSKVPMGVVSQTSPLNSGERATGMARSPLLLLRRDRRTRCHERPRRV